MFCIDVKYYSFPFLGEMQRIAFRLMLSSHVCVSVCVYVCRVLDLRKTAEDRDVVFVLTAWNNTEHNL